MENLLEELSSFFAEDDWPMQPIEGHTALRTAYEGQAGQFTCVAQAIEEQRAFIFYSICPLEVPADRRQEVAEFITRANYSMIVGNFELSLDDGDVRFRTSVRADGFSLFPALIRELVHTNVMIMDRYLPGLVAVIAEERSPIAALELVETGAEQAQ